MSILSGLKVCFLAGTLGQGGAERQLYYQLQALKLSGSCPLVISFSDGDHWQPLIESLGVPVFALGKISSRIGRLQKIYSILEHERPQIVQSAHFYTNLYAMLAARFLSLNEIGTVRSDGFRDVAETGWLAGRLSLWLPRLLALNSRFAFENVVSLGRSRRGVFYIPNVVDTTRFVPLGSIPTDVFHILMVGRLAAPKRFDSFLRLLSNLRQQSEPSVFGHIVGDGPDRLKLENLARDLGLGPAQVCFHGSISDVEHLYRQAHLCLHLSDWEGTPNTVLEAMACGLPVIASRVGGIPELMQDGRAGLLLDPGDETSLLGLFECLLQDTGLRQSLGIDARAFILQNHNLNRLPVYLEQFYREILL